MYPSAGEIEDLLRAAGPGAQGYVVVPGVRQPSHVINAVNEGGFIVFADSQKGEIVDPGGFEEIYAFIFRG